MAKIYAGIVLYNPDINRLKLNIEAIYEQVDKIILVDNGSSNVVDAETLISEYNNCCLISNDDNEGIAKALNQIFECAIDEQADWVLTLDQDSICPSNMIDSYKQHIAEHVGIICPKLNILGWNLEETAEDPDVEEVSDCITSGALTSVKAWTEVGGFNEDYFIDLVDSEFSKKLTNNHLAILRDNRVIMQHEVGESVEKKIGSHVLRCTKHSPIRCYYMVRNHFMYIKTYKEQLNMSFEKKMLLHKIITSYIVAEDKKQTIKMMYRGYRDYKRNIVGKDK